MKLRNCDLFTRTLRARPLMSAAIAYLAGCIMGYVTGFSPWIWLICTGLFLLPVFLIKKSRGAYLALAIVAAMLPFGAFRFAHAWDCIPIVESKNPVYLSGRIVSMPEYRADAERTICVLDDITIDGETQTYKLRLYLRGDPLLLQNVRISDVVSCKAHLWRADAASNEGQFSFQNYLRLNGLSGYATAEIEGASFVQTDSRPAEKLEQFKALVGNSIEALFPNNAAIARAFLIGDRSQLSEYDRENFSKSGVAHLLAISGMHISVLASMLSLLLSRLMGKKPAFAVTLAVLILYGVFIGFTPSFLRALTLFTLYSIAPILGRNYDAPTSLSAAMLLYLLIRPVGILESGFSLSFGASAGIVFLSSPLRALTHTEAMLARRPRRGLAALLRDRLPKWCVSSIIVSLSAQIAIYPIVINNFGYQSPWTLLANLICVPLAMVSYVASIVGALSGVPCIASMGDQLFGLLKECTRFFSDLPLSDHYCAHFPAYLCLIFAVCLFLSSDLSRLSMKIRRFLPLALIPAILIANLLPISGLKGCSIVFFDAGQADCAAVRCGGKLYFIDTGDAYTPAVDYMQKYAYRPEAVFLSHCHDDHAGGLNAILDYCPPKTLYLSANWDAYEAGAAVSTSINRARELGCEIVFLSAGDEIRLSEQTFLRVLSPEAGFSANSANNDSLVLHLEYCGLSALFTGDCGADVLAKVAPDADILKVPHHGSEKHTNTALIELVTPTAAFVPVGYNTFGHPSAEALRLLEGAGTKVYRGDQCGEVVFTLHQNGEISARCYQNPEEINGLE